MNEGRKTGRKEGRKEGRKDDMKKEGMFVGMNRSDEDGILMWEEIEKREVNE